MKKYIFTICLFGCSNPQPFNGDDNGQNNSDSEKNGDSDSDTILHVDDSEHDSQTMGEDTNTSNREDSDIDSVTEIYCATESEIQNETDTGFESDAIDDTGIYADTVPDTENGANETGSTVFIEPDFVCDGHAPENGCATSTGCTFEDLYVCLTGEPVPILAINYKYGWRLCTAQQCPIAESECFLVHNTIGLSCHE
jgi:hypothetical protein